MSYGQNVDSKNPVAGTWSRFMEQERLRAIPGDWIPFAHVDLDLLPDPEYGGCETEPSVRGSLYFESKWARYSGSPWHE